MTTQTTPYGWTKPDVGGSSSQWGTIINNDLDAIAAQVSQNQNLAIAGQSPIGSITMFGGATPPTNWLICDGSSLLISNYTALYGVIGKIFGSVDSSHFTLPYLIQRFPIGAGPNPLGNAGGSFAAAITVANLPPHAHAITDVSHNHGINQTAHIHPDGGHAHSVNDPQHSHGIPGSMGYGVGSISPPSVLNSGGGPMSTNLSGTGISIQSSSANIGAQNANISLNASGTGLTTTQNTGSGTDISVVPPYIALNFIIRFQ